jgi:hypothetical protein
VAIACAFWSFRRNCYPEESIPEVFQRMRGNLLLSGASDTLTNAVHKWLEFGQWSASELLRTIEYYTWKRLVNQW